MINLIIGFL